MPSDERLDLLADLWEVRCELSTEVVLNMSNEELAAHLRDAHNA